MGFEIIIPNPLNRCIQAKGGPGTRDKPCRQAPTRAEISLHPGPGKSGINDLPGFSQVAPVSQDFDPPHRGVSPKGFAQAGLRLAGLLEEVTQPQVSPADAPIPGRAAHTERQGAISRLPNAGFGRQTGQSAQGCISQRPARPASGSSYLLPS